MAVAGIVESGTELLSTTAGDVTADFKELEVIWTSVVPEPPFSAGGLVFPVG
jgi:hypothetical protein